MAAAAGRLTRLWLRSLDALAAQPLEGTENAVSPFWSPDGRFLAFFSEGRLRKVAVQGGRRETLCEHGVRHLGHLERRGDDPLLPVHGAEGRPVAHLRVGRRARACADRCRGPRVLAAVPSGRPPLPVPDGRLRGRRPQGLLHVGSLDSPASQRLIPVDSRATYVAGGRLVFARDGALMTVPFDASRRTIGGEATPLGETVSYLRASGAAFFSASPDGRALVYVPLPAPTQLTWLDRAGRPTGTVGEPARIFGVRLSPDGKKTVAHIFDLRKGARDIWVDDLERGVRSRLTADPGTPCSRSGIRGVSGSPSARPAGAARRRSMSGGRRRRARSGSCSTPPASAFARDWSPTARASSCEDYSPDRRVRFQLWILDAGPAAAPHAVRARAGQQVRPAVLSRRTAARLHLGGDRPPRGLRGLPRRHEPPAGLERGRVPAALAPGRARAVLPHPDGELVAVSVTPGPRSRSARAGRCSRAPSGPRPA